MGKMTTTARIRRIKDGNHVTVYVVGPLTRGEARQCARYARLEFTDGWKDTRVVSVYRRGWRVWRFIEATLIGVLLGGMALVAWRTVVGW